VANRLTGPLVATGVAVAALFVAEGLVRMTLSDSVVLFPRYHTEADYGDFHIRRLRPNTDFWHTSRDGKWEFKTNAQGFRDWEPYTYEKPAGQLRTIVMGDSHTMGFEVRQGRTYAADLERYLQRDVGSAEVMNTGVSGFSTAEALVFLENEGIKYSPDWVVLGFYANDLEDNVKAGLFALEDGKLVVRKHEHVPGVGILDAVNDLPPLRWLSENSYFYSLLLNTVWDTGKRLLLSREVEKLTTEYAVAKDDVGSYGRELATALVERMYAFCKSHGIGLVIVDIPQPDDATGFKPSVPGPLVPVMAANSDAFIRSEKMLGEYRGVAEFFVPHGQRHISEFTHLMIARAVARAIEAHRDTQPGQPPEAQPQP